MLLCDMKAAIELIWLSRSAIEQSKLNGTPQVGTTGSAASVDRCWTGWLMLLAAEGMLTKAAIELIWLSRSAIVVG